MTSAQPAFPPLFTTPLPAPQTASNPIPLPVSECVTAEKGLFSHRNSQCNPDRLQGGLTPSLAVHAPCTITGMLCHIHSCFLNYKCFFCNLPFPFQHEHVPAWPLQGSLELWAERQKKELLISYFIPGTAFEIIYFYLVAFIPFLYADGRTKWSNKDCPGGSTVRKELTWIAGYIWLKMEARQNSSDLTYLFCLIAVTSKTLFFPGAFPTLYIWMCVHPYACKRSCTCKCESVNIFRCWEYLNCEKDKG